ncbi:fused MFS/spermidine synthase [Salinactinospora qingdaonensis]|uniref:fused MFS/spermidine synthase n=1 Tax=Salinactinospora qingdaonensis TaxID=702744 RepID=UPI0031EC3B26
MNRFLATTVVIFASAVVLVLEVTATRLVAPYAGDTLETYTAAIGVALGAIAVGAKLGGDAADRWRPDRLLGPLLVLGGGLTMLSRPIVLVVGPSLVGTGPFAALLLVALGIALPVALLSAVTPVVVKTQLADLHHTGGIVGRFSAWGTVGALAGTFLTGYVFIAALPVSAILLLTGSALIAFGAFLLLRHALSSLSRQAMAVLGLTVVSSGLLLGVASPCDAETAYYCARVTTDPANPSGRVLLLDDLRHGYVDVADPTHLEFAYTQWFAAAIAARAGEAPVSTLHIGGGAYTMPRWLAATRPGSTSHVFEVDPAVTELARSRLQLRTGPRLSVSSGDARIAITTAETDRYDVVIGDAFGGLSVPWHLTTREFLAEIERVLKPGGIYVANIIDYGPRSFLQAEVATVGVVFDTLSVIGHRASDSAVRGGNHVIVATDGALARGELRRAVATAPTPGHLTAQQQVARWQRQGQVLTDDYAPVDQLLTPYLT